jgi:peptidoglycan/xylan/chitin deacetylase (PgdA/CDA1 family)
MLNTIAGVFICALFAQHAFAVERPPQFVMLAFDGSLDVDFWEKSRAFAREMKEQNKPLNFTYFMSGVYFINDDDKDLYYAPNHGPGKSTVGFGGPLQDIAPRVAEVNKAYQEGHEIGSHANCHFDGTDWSLSDWTKEFTQFWHFIFDVFAVNKLALPSGSSQAYLFDKSEIVGFRAPYLSTNKSMYTALKDFGFKYDTSQDGDPDYWPARNNNGIWNFALADLVIYGTHKKTLSMDYNFFVAQSGGEDDPKNKDLYGEQMLNTYLNWFQNNYNGNRAPINIGHHFWPYQKGAYWEAEKQFASKVCGLPEVRCVTYSTYMKWLENLDSDTLSSYRDGNFPRAKSISVLDSMSQTASTESLASALPLRIVQKADGSLMAHVTVQNFAELQNYTARFTVNGQEINSSEVTVQEVRDIAPQGSPAKVVAHLVDRRTDVEVARATQQLRNVGTEQEFLDTNILEDRARLGDLPEAHRRGYNESGIEKADVR